MKKRLGWILFFTYVLFLLWLTIFSRQPRVGERVFKWELLWAYRAWIAGESFGRTESIQNINNILVFIPFGALFPGKRWKQLLITAVLFSGALFPGKRWKQLLITAVLFSTVIEAVQYCFNLGWCEIDDVICNVLGAAIGFGLWKLIKGKMHAL